MLQRRQWTRSVAAAAAAGQDTSQHLDTGEMTKHGKQMSAAAMESQAGLKLLFTHSYAVETIRRPNCKAPINNIIRTTCKELTFYSKLVGW